MKKLMIAAAAAAMIGGVQAATATYDFVANLRTTTGHQGTDAYTADAANLGVNGNRMWYQDNSISFEQIWNTGFGRWARTVTNDFTLVDMVDVSRDGMYSWKSADGANNPDFAAIYPHLEWIVGESKGGVAYPKFNIIPSTMPNGKVGNLLNANEAALIKALALVYDEPSYGYWCGQYSWYTYAAKQCYRVAGADKIVREVKLDRPACCDRSVNDWFYSDDRDFVDFEPTEEDDGLLLNRFGAQTADAANLLEIYARVLAQTSVSKFWFRGYLAGQGSQAVQFPTPKAAGDPAINVPVQISGSIVGYTEAPECPDCCVRPLPKAIAFECLNTDEASEPNTAAYGTFYLRLKSFVQ